MRKDHSSLSPNPSPFDLAEDLIILVLHLYSPWRIPEKFGSITEISSMHLLMAIGYKPQDCPEKYELEKNINVQKVQRCFVQRCNKS